MFTFQGEVSAEPTRNDFTATVISVIYLVCFALLVLLPIYAFCILLIYPVQSSVRIGVLTLGVLLLLICVYLFWEDLKYYVRKMWTIFYKHRSIKRMTSSLHELLLLSALIVMTSVITDKGLLEATVIGSVIFFFLALSESVWNFYDLIIQKVNSFILSVWIGYCQYIRPARFAVRQQIFLPALILMITLIAQRCWSSITCSLTAVSVLFLRLSVRVPSYNLMVNQPYSY